VDVAAFERDIRAEGGQSLQVQVDRSRAPGAAARQRDERLALEGQQRAQHVDARAHLAHQIVRGLATLGLRGAQAQLAADQAALAVDQQKLADANAKLATDQAAQPPVPSTVIAADKLAVAQAQQSVARDQTAIANDQVALTTAKNTSVTVAANAAQVAQARAAVTQAENQVATAKSQLATAKTSASATTITAPVAGIVTAVNLTVGQAPPTSSAITMRSDTLTVVANVAEQDVANLTVGQTAQVTITAVSTTEPATITTLPTSANSSSTGSGAVTFPLSLVLTANPKGVLPGMTASIAIVTASAKNVLNVPTTAIQGTAPNNTVQLLANGAPQSTPVSLGLSTNSTTEIISGVQVGQVVVTGVVNPTASTSTTGGVGGLTGRTGGFGGTGGGFPGGARPGG
jgi:macrolide-specific efflux system membrane fusion protein